jgi:hypothetical protein
MFREHLYSMPVFSHQEKTKKAYTHSGHASNVPTVEK